MKALLKTLALVVGIPAVYAIGIIVSVNSGDRGWIGFSVAWPLFAAILGAVLFLVWIAVKTLFIHFDRHENPDLYERRGGEWRRNSQRRKVWWMT